jgi:transcriptional regulator NrdR family protein
MKTIIVNEREIIIKKLGAMHFFKVSKLAAKLNLNIKELYKKANGIRKIDKEKSKEEFEGQPLNLIINEVFSKLHMAEDEINSIITSVTGLTLKELNELDIVEYIKILKEVITSPGFLDLFKQGN